MYNKITKKFQYYFSFISEYLKKKDYMTENISTVRRKEKDERKRRKNKKEERILHINHITYYIYHIYKFYHTSSICVYKLFHIHYMLLS